MTAQPNDGAAMFDTLKPDIRKAFRDIPAFGSVGFEVFFQEGAPVRVEYHAALSRRLPPKSDRGRA